MAEVYKRTETRKRKGDSMTVSGRRKLSTVLTFLWCPVAIQEPSKGAELGIHPLSATSGDGLDSSCSAFRRPRNLYDTCFVFIVSGRPSIYELAYFEFPATRKRHGCRFSWIVAGDRAQSRFNVVVGRRESKNFQRSVRNERLRGTTTTRT